MQTKLITPVIMAGGSGTRLWPVSRKDTPKQFCDLGFGKTLFQESLARVDNKMLFGKPIVICSAKHETVVRMQAEEVGVSLGQVIAEPMGRNTAPAIALAVCSGRVENDGLMLVLPSDHRIADETQFQADVIAARQTAREGKRIVLFGIKPDALETGYGYVRAGIRIGNSACKQISEFIEKPDAKSVELLVQEAGIFWNSGMFFARKDVLKQELRKHAKGVLETVRCSIPDATIASKAIHPDEAIFANAPDISFDYAVMEATEAAAICPLKTGWSDLGSWKAIWENSELDDSKNVLKGEVFDSGSSGCLVATDGPLVGTCGLEDVVVIAKRDAVLVCHRDQTQGVKEIVGKLSEAQSPSIKSHTGEVRPWGKFESLDRGDNHQVKRITVNPGGQLSLQYHFHRSEHWIVVRGIATVTVDEDVQELGPCQQVFIPQGAVHRLENFTDEPVEIIEVQYGSYFGEDDIVRVEDVYDRPETENNQSQPSAA